MAQHIPIRCMKQKAFRKVEESIRKRASYCIYGNGVAALSSSFKYEEIDMDEWDREKFNIPSHHRYFIRPCKIRGYEVGVFEIIVDEQENKIVEIYYVA